MQKYPTKQQELRGKLTIDSATRCHSLKKLILRRNLKMLNLYNFCNVDITDRLSLSTLWWKVARQVLSNGYS